MVEHSQLYDECSDCVADKGLYHRSRACCWARYLVSLPLLELRRGWLERLKARVSAKFYAEIERSTKMRWEKIKGKHAKNSA